MDFFDVLSLVGGIAMFLFGMEYMGDALKKTAGGKMQQILERLTSNRFMGILLGAAVTAVIQASGATTVMVVGFVNSGIMTLEQAVGVIMGANIGTTVTSWILSLTGIQGDSFGMQLLKPTSWTPVLALIGVGLLMFSKKDKKKNIGGILIGFAVLMFGMNTMTTSVAGLKDVPQFTRIMTAFSNPFLGVLFGAVVTAAIQSSSASVGILQALCNTGKVTYGLAVPIIMGQNIGTCVTALISSIGASKNAKRTALIHFYFNLIGTIVFMILFYLGNAILDFGFLGTSATAAGIATIHSVFNITATILWLPFSNLLVKLAKLTVPDREEKKPETDAYDEDLRALDPRFLETPSYAVKVAFEKTQHMAALANEAFADAVGLIPAYSGEGFEKVREMEGAADRYEDKIGTYLVRISEQELQKKDGRMLTQLMHAIGDIERISDHAMDIAIIARKMDEKKDKFSKKAREELDVLIRAVREILDITLDSFARQDAEEAEKVEPLEQAIDELDFDLQKRHIRRLQKGKCTIELGMDLTDITTIMERVSDHCSNIAAAQIEIEDDNSFDTHEYLAKVRHEDPAFQEMFRAYREKYHLPVKSAASASGK